MTSIEFDDSTPDDHIQGLAVKVCKEGLYAAVESGRQIKKFIPPDSREKEELVKIALRKDFRYHDPLYFRQCASFERHSFERQFILLNYSNNPNQIREFEIF